MVKLTGTFSKLQKAHILVIGDFMLDRYTYGEINRISPEAPVSILKVIDQDFKPGGAGNVALNLLSLGSDVTLIGRIGKDDDGAVLKKLLKDKGANVDYLVTQKDYKTSVKNRFIAESQQLLRVDFEKLLDISKSLEDEILEILPSLLKTVKVVAISDYGKGFLSKKLIKTIIKKAKEKDIPTIIDPKGSDFKKYKSATILKPNLKEAYVAANLQESEPLDKAAQLLLKKTKVDHLLITRSKDGISLFSKNERQDFKARSKEVKDVTGAGDTVLAMLCICIANNLSLDNSCALCNIAASIAIEHIGCAQINLSDFAKRLLEYDVGNKIFDFSHLFALKKVIENKKVSLLCLKNSNSLNPSIFQAIKKLSKIKNDVIIYILDQNPNDHFVDLLASLNEIGFIILHNKNLKNLSTEIKPFNIYLMKDEKLQKLDNMSKIEEI
ncbi:MAG: Bifunctional protein HldE [Candidatus Anoxychlamydiales bacterium]|nr:Bifunctional protein HldE [Candidatus Anoxychlamydiales bacterium]